MTFKIKANYEYSKIRILGLVLFFLIYFILFLLLASDDVNLLIPLNLFIIYSLYLILREIPRYFLIKKATRYQDNFRQEHGLKNDQTYCRGCGATINQSSFKRLALNKNFFSIIATNLFGVKGYYCKRDFLKYCIIDIIIIVGSVLACLTILTLTFLLYFYQLSVFSKNIAIFLIIIYFVLPFVYLIFRCFQYSNYT